jgi:ATP-dependent exoDNAse (exonuclease V) alpha subunit
VSLRSTHAAKIARTFQTAGAYFGSMYQLRPYQAQRELHNMAIYHLSVKIIGRGSGRSSVASAAYRSGSKIRNERAGMLHNYTRKTGIAHSEILLPETAPPEFQDRSVLWNAVETSEKRRDAQTAREVEAALPRELNLQESIELLHEYIQDNFVSAGMCADLSVHDKEDGNPHAHIMLTTRDVTKKGFGGKNRDWNDKALLESWREKWAEVCNKRLQEKGLAERIDHRTLKEQGIDRKPTLHVGRSKEREIENLEIIKRNTSAGYTSGLQRKVEQHLTECSEMRREVQRLERRAKDIAEHSAQLRDQRAREYFKRIYQIDPKDAAAEIRRLKAQSEKLAVELKEKTDTFTERNKALELDNRRGFVIGTRAYERER